MIRVIGPEKFIKTTVCKKCEAVLEYYNTDARTSLGTGSAMDFSDIKWEIRCPICNRFTPVIMDFNTKV